MAKFRKKPVVIEAWQARQGVQQYPDWLNAAFDSGVIQAHGPELRIKTLEGVMTASAGDWIIQGVKGELYSCKDEIFKMTYEAVEA